MNTRKLLITLGGGLLALTATACKPTAEAEAPATTAPATTEAPVTTVSPFAAAHARAFEAWNRLDPDDQTQVCVSTRAIGRDAMVDLIVRDISVDGEPYTIDQVKIALASMLQGKCEL